MTDTTRPKSSPVYLTMPPLNPRSVTRTLKITILLAFLCISTFVTAKVTGQIAELAEKQLIAEERIASANNKSIFSLRQALEDLKKFEENSTGGFRIASTQSTPHIDQSFDEYKKNKNAVRRGL